MQSRAVDGESLTASPQGWADENRAAPGAGLGLIALAWLAVHASKTV
jgi:hypothetical protein